MVSSVVLAAGESSRMGSPKALLEFQRKTFVETITERIHQTGVDEIIVVLGAHVEDVMAHVPFQNEKVVCNREYYRGQLSSLQCGLNALDPRAQAALVTLVDHPLVKVETYRGMVAAWRHNPGMIQVAACGERGGHPVIFPRGVFDELLNAPLDVGARAVVRSEPSRVRRVAFNDPGITADIDTPGDYRRFVR